MSVQKLPFISVQDDWDVIVRDVSTNTTKQGNFWISCHLENNESVQDSVLVEQGEETKLIGKESITVEYINSRSFKASCPTLGVENVIIYGPKTEYNLTKKAVECLDVSPNGQLIVAGQGSEAHILNVSEGKTVQKLTGHIGDVTAVQFFPSSLVVLTGGADFQLKVWSVLNGSNPVTLQGHTSAITSVAIIAVGRNVLSSSRDGTIKLWNCGTSSTITTFGNYNSPINKMIITSLPNQYEPAEPESLDPLEVETADKMVLVALDDGTVRGIHLGIKKELFATPASDVGLTAINYDPETGLLVTGNKQGQVELFSLFKSTSESILRWKRSRHSVTSLVFKHNKDDDAVLYISHADGNIYETKSLTPSVIENGISVKAEYTGNELETVYDVKVFKGEYERLACGTRDGKIKLY